MPGSAPVRESRQPSAAIPDMHRLPSALAIALLLALSAGKARAADCGAAVSPSLATAQFTSMVRSQQPQDQLLYLPPGSREVYVHATTRGPGKIIYRWFRDGRRVIDVGAQVGNGEWHTWSRLRLPPPVPGEVRVQILGPEGCLLKDLTLAATAFVDNESIRKAWKQIAANDGSAAKLTLKLLLEETPRNSKLGRAAQRLLDFEVAVTQAHERAGGDELFLVEPALKQVEKRLGRSAADRALRARIAEVREIAALRGKELASEGNYMALATRHLLETRKIVSGDYPLWREDAEKLLNPALAHAGNTYAVVDWEPTLRGYRLVLQDKRSGVALEVTPN